MPVFRLNRRQVMLLAGAGGLSLAGVACSQPAASPTAASKVAATAPPAKTAAPPTAKPATAAPTAAAKTAPTAVPKPTARTYSTVKFPFAGAVTIPANVSWGVGMEKNFFKGYGIDLDITYIRGTAQLIPAMVAGQGWLGWLATAGTLASIDKGSPLKIVGGGYTAPSYAFFSQPEYKSMKDLEGKAVGTDQPGSLTYDLTSMVLKDAGLEGKVQLVAVGPTPDIFKALLAKKLDAGLGTVTFIPQAEEAKLVLVEKLWEKFPKYSSAAFVTTDDAIKNHRDEIVRAMAGFIKTYNYVLTDAASKTEWVKVATDQYKEDAGNATFEWQWYKENKGFAANLAITADEIDYMQNLNKDKGAQSKVLPTNQVADLSILKDAQALTK